MCGARKTTPASKDLTKLRSLSGYMLTCRRSMHAEMHTCMSLPVIRAGKRGTMEHVFSQTERKRRGVAGSSFQLGHI